jgi:hypothetical protein
MSPALHFKTMPSSNNRLPPMLCDAVAISSVDRRSFTEQASRLIAQSGSYRNRKGRSMRGQRFDRFRSNILSQEYHVRCESQDTFNAS